MNGRIVEATEQMCSSGALTEESLPNKLLSQLEGVCDNAVNTKDRLEGQLTQINYLISRTEL